MNPKIIKWFVRKSLGLKYEPMFAKIEITRRCNLNCVMCYRTQMKEAGDMSFEDFKIIIDKCNFVKFSPHGWGEPTIHPDFIKFIKYAKSKGVFAGLVTNGTLMNEKMNRDYLSTNPEYINFSMESPFKEEYEKIRRGANYDIFVSNIKNAIKLRTEISPSTKIQVHMTTHIKTFRKNIPATIKFCDEIGVDELQVNDMFWEWDYGESTKENAIMPNITKREIKDIIKTFPNPNHTKVNYAIYQQDYRRCPLPWISTYIDIFGDVYPCTGISKTTNYRMDNIFEQSMKEIYNNDKYKQFRKDTVIGKSKNCNRCILWHVGKCPLLQRYISRRLFE